MIDWFSGQIGCDARDLKLEHIVFLGLDNRVKYAVEKWREVQGSYCDKVRVRRCSPHRSVVHHVAGCPDEVYQLSGNPTKFLQGHNVFGPSVTLLEPLVRDTLARLPAEVRPAADDWGLVHGLIHASRVDITVMVDLGSHELVHEWLRHAAAHTRSRHGRPLVSGTTVYWNSGSERWGMKVYCKFCEMKEHPPLLREFRDLVSPFVETQLRFELTLRGKELALLKEKGAELAESLVWRYFERVECGVMKTDGMARSEKLGYRVRPWFELWLGGRDVRMGLPRSTFYYYRRRILDVVGVDIAGDPQEVGDRYPRINLDREFLRSHEVQVLPEVLDKYLWRPAEVSDLKIGVS